MGKSKGKLRMNANKSARLIVEEAEDYNNMVPLFSLERLETGPYCLSNLDKDDKAAFADSMFKRRSTTWNEIQQMPRHGLGYEKIAVISLLVTPPKFITEDQSNVLAFRFNGLKPMVGYRVRNIFYVLWFDHKFSVYPHG